MIRQLSCRPPGRGFSLVELIIVMVIIGLLAAIVVPRVSQSSRRASEAALRKNLQTLREMIDLYAAEHEGFWPASRSAGSGAAAGTPEAFERQLTWYTSPAGEARAKLTPPCILKPYLDSIPELSVGAHAGGSRVSVTASALLASPPKAADGADGRDNLALAGVESITSPVTDTGGDEDSRRQAAYGWMYSTATGEIRPHCPSSEQASDGTYYWEW